MATEPRPLNPKYAKAKTPRAGAKRGRKVPTDTATQVDHLMLDTSTTLETMTGDEKDELQKNVLAARISDDIRTAIQSRQGSGIEEIWADSEDLYNGVDQNLNAPVKTRDQVPRRAAAGGGRAKVVLNIVKPKTDIAVSRIAEMLVPTDERPWDFKPTPIPDLDPKKMPDGQMVTLSDGKTQVDAKVIAMKEQVRAQEACDNAILWVEDGFVEGDVYTELRKQIRNAGRIGTGVLKGPFGEVRTIKVWEADQSGQMSLVTKREVAPTSKAIRAEDCFPDPACGDSVHKGGFFIERDFMTGKALRALAELPDYDSMLIAQALAEGPSTFAKARSRTMLGGRRQEGSTENDAQLFEVYYYYGEVRPEDMVLMGMGREQNKLVDPTDPEQGFTDELDPATAGGLTDDEMQLYTLPAIVTMLNGRPIKCSVNPAQSGCFPYHFFAWDQIEGQPWGRGIPFKMAVAQRMLTAGARALMENAGLSSGPQIAISRGALKPANDVYEITGRKLWYYDSDEFNDDIRKAMATFDIPSQQKELMGIIEFALKMADTLTNLPILLQGEQQPGGAPETLGGMKMFMQNASSPLRNIAKNHDDSVTKPHLKDWYDWLMEHGPDNAKGDHTIQAKGSTVLVQREESRAFLMQLLPVLGNAEFDINPAKWVAEVSKANGFTMSSIQYTEDEKAERDKKAQENPPPPPPAVQAAQINAQAMTERAKAANEAAISQTQLRTEQEVEDRKLRVQELELKKEIAMLDNSTKRGIALDQVKKELAIAAMGNSMEQQDMQLKLDPRNKTGTGIAGGVGDHKPGTP